MIHTDWCRRALVGFIAFACTSLGAAELVHPDHYEFDASLHVPFGTQDRSWPITLFFDYPGAGSATQAAWMLDIIAPDGRIVSSQNGITAIGGQHTALPAIWNGRDTADRKVAPGYYTVRLRATPTVATALDRTRSTIQQVGDAFAAFPDEVIEQSYDVMVGSIAAPRMPDFKALGIGLKSRSDMHAKSASAGGLPYTIYYGNLHSQTNHSDGGTLVGSCDGAEVPQRGTKGPSDAYAMMQTQAGGDFLLTSEHNHMFDGSTGTNASAVPATAINLFHSGLQMANSYRAAHPDFLALYGLEWGVISNGGHLNLINADALAEWEVNGSGQLIGEVSTPKSNYPALYATMKQRGWIGQFNHPATSGQFLVNGTALGYDANGGDVMVLAEVLNSSAFSTNTTQTEASRSSYVGAWNKLLEAGYKVAPTSDQDNHCANWGLSFTNRTGVLLPSGSALTTTSFFDALRARRTFATEDKAGQLVLTANGRVMGETFASSGTLSLTANYASSNGQTTQRVQFFEGVPGRSGTVTQLTEGSGTYSFTPANGAHFYYALVTQANGLRLWSAPVWVNQGSSSTDTTPPSVGASETGSGGVVTFSATAADNVGVTHVEFYVDGTLKGNDATSPYSTTLDSTTLANGSHSLTAKAYDAAGNSATSTAVAFNVSNTTQSTQLILNPGFESGAANWTASSGAITTNSTYPAHGGTWKAWLNGYGSANTEFAWQGVTIPSTVASANLSFWLRVDSDETSTTTAYDTLTVQLRNSSNAIVATLGMFSNINKGTSYVQHSFNVSAYKGQALRVYFEGVEGTKVATSFLIDDVTLTSQ